MPNDKERTLEDKWFAGFIAVCLTIGALVGAVSVISLEMAIWGAGFGNFFFWHTGFAVFGLFSSRVYKRVLRSLP